MNLTELDKENLLSVLNYFLDNVILFEEDEETDIITKGEVIALIHKLKEY